MHSCGPAVLDCGYWASAAKTMWKSKSMGRVSAMNRRKNYEFIFQAKESPSADT